MQLYEISVLSVNRCRNLRKIQILLQAFEDAGKDIDYYALDLSLRELERTLAELPEYKHVSCHGLWGTYDDGKEWLKGIEGKPKAILHMGSSIGICIYCIPLGGRSC